jgi:hypothetical protein
MITATLADGPLEGKSIEAEVVEGRPPKIIDVPLRVLEPEAEPDPVPWGP